MIITAEQMSLLSGFRCERIKNTEYALVQSLRGAMVEGQETSLAFIFKDKNTLQEDQDDTLASYLILTPANEVLGFFSLRCGELYRRVDIAKMELCRNAWDSLMVLRNNPMLPPDEKSKHIDAIRKAIKAGVNNPDEMQAFAAKSRHYEYDKSKWSGKNIEHVSDVYPAVELKLFGINEDAKQLWKSFSLPQRFGETLFWQVIVEQIEKISGIVGCQYVYLFAADKEPDGELVNYYQTRLHFSSSPDLSANKPHFDFNCQFMYQDMNTLKKYKRYFFDHFNSAL